MAGPRKFYARLGGQSRPGYGMANIVRNYNSFLDYIVNATPEILIDALTPTFELSQEYCPVDTGDLKDSGYLEIVRSGKSPRVEIGYGRGGEPEYTIAVHENLEWRHKAPTRAKWLQIALEEDASNIQKRIEEAYKGIF